MPSRTSSPRTPVAQNQDDYNAKYDALVSNYEAVKKRRNEVAGEIRQKGIRRREFARFIDAVEKLPNEVTEFEESMWSDLVESITVHAKDDHSVHLTLRNGNQGISTSDSALCFFGGRALFSL